MKNIQANECNWKFPTMNQTRIIGSISTIMIPKCVEFFLTIMLLTRIVKETLWFVLIFFPWNLKTAIHQIPLVIFYKIKTRAIVIYPGHWSLLFPARVTELLVYLINHCAGHPMFVPSFAYYTRPLWCINTLCWNKVNTV